MEKVSIREISRRTGFSPATVSKALNRRPGVSPQTVELISKAARELGYQRSERLEQVKFVLARKSGRVIDDNAFHPVVIEGVERQARQYDLQTTFVYLDATEEQQCRDQIRELCCDASSAIVLLGTELGETEFDLFANAKARVVLLDSWSDCHYFDTVVMANEDSVLRAVRYLIDRGHRRIGYLAGDFRIQNFRYRERGYRRALEAAGLEAEPGLRVTVGTTLETAHHDMAAWVAGRSRDDMPTAFFADNDVIAVGAMRALSEAGYVVPDDISFIGFDDVSIGAFSNPPLTTIHVQKREMGQLAVRMLMEAVQDPQPYTRKTQVSTTFIERASVRSLT